jgi:hypothetical protein
MRELRAESFPVFCQFNTEFVGRKISDSRPEKKLKKVGL